MDATGSEKTGAKPAKNRGQFTGKNDPRNGKGRGHKKDRTKTDEIIRPDEETTRLLELIGVMLGRPDLPEGVRENITYRKGVLEKAAVDPEERQRLRERCKADTVFWVNTFAWQYNPNSIGEGSLEMGPFVVWDGQEEMFVAVEKAIEDRKDMIIEKSRDMGASWGCLLVMVKAFVLCEWKKFLMISRSEDAVDRAGDPDSLFWKIDFVLEHLPGWMKGTGIKRRKLGYSNSNGCTITGQASTRKAGVGGRAHAMFIDEFSQIDEDYEVLHRTSDTTGCRIFNGTHRGSGTAFAEVVNRVDIRKVRLHWSKHPDKAKGLYRWSPQLGRVEVLDKDYVFPPDYQFVCDGSPTGGPYPGLRSPWYDEQCRRKGNARAVAMDLDIDPQGSVEQVFDTLRLRFLQETHCCPPYWEGDVLFDPDTGRPKGLVESPGGPLRLWIHPRDGVIPYDVYAGGADISTGNGATPSCITFVASKTGLKVAEYTHTRLYPEKFALVACALCWLFRTEEGEGAYVAWETQGPGVTFGKVLTEDLGYRNVYYYRDERKLNGKVSDKPGWFVSTDGKNAMIREYSAALMGGLFVNRSREALEECRDFKYDQRGNVVHAKEDVGEFSGARVNHGDHVIADALACKMAKGKLTQVKKEHKEPVIGSLAWRRQWQESRRQEEEGW